MTAARFDVAAERRRLEGSSAAELRQRYQEIGVKALSQEAVIFAPCPL